MAAKLTVCVRTAWPFRTNPPAQSISTCPSTARKVSWLQSIYPTPPLLSLLASLLLFQEEKVVMLYFVLCFGLSVAV